MTAYVDASVVLRIALKASDPWPGFRSAKTLVSSVLTRVECQRVMDRVRLTGELSDEPLAATQAHLAALLKQVQFIDLDERQLTRAGEPLPAALGTLDAIHLATARIWCEEWPDDFQFITHDRSLRRAARMMNLSVAGL